jgi:hypothetical protein
MSGKKELTIQDVTASETSLVNEKQWNFLFRKTPASQIKTRPAKGGGTWDFVSGSYVKKVLNFISGFNWDFEVMESQLLLECGQVVILGKLTIRLKGQQIVKMQYGRSDIKFRRNTKIPLDVGNDFKAASTDALKKCASELGVAADIYGKQDFKEVSIMENTPINSSNIEIEAKMKACSTAADLETFFNDNKSAITRSIDLTSLLGKLKKQFQNEK